jgi:lipopolysaccharide transport system permease protein
MAKESTRVTTIRPVGRWPRLNVAELWAFRDLFFALGVRDLRVRYRQTMLGVSWVVLQPVLAALIFTFVFNRVARLPSDGKPYFLFAYSGTVCWGTFSSTLTRTSGAVIGNASLVSKVHFPRILLPLSALVSAVVDASVGIGVLAALLLFVGHDGLTWAALLIPFWISIAALTAAGVGTAAGAIIVRHRDLNQVLSLVLQLLLYGSPVAYASSVVPRRFLRLYNLNPLVGVLQGFRWSTIGTDPPSVSAVLYAAGVVVALGFVGVTVFSRLEAHFADVI